MVALIGALTLWLKEDLLRRLLLILVAFSAGALFAGSFHHLLPEALEKLSKETTFLLFTFGFVLFFTLEKFIHWHHCHQEKCIAHPFTYLILLGDGLHNFIDGMIIAASFLIDWHLGIVTSLIILLHEIPQELGDFGVLVYGGLGKKKALIFNFLSQLTCILGALMSYLAHSITNLSFLLLPIAAGGFLYISASDLIPEIKKEESPKKSIMYFITFLLGMLLIYLLGFLE
jgi:zinc and cadmium transporter